MMAVALLLALALDTILGELRKWHPLVGLGHLANWLERHNNISGKPLASKLLGLFALLLLLVPAVVLGQFIDMDSVAGFIIAVLLLYLCIGLRSLGEHAQAVYQALEQQHLEQAREKVSWIVSRNTQQMNETEIATATVESVLENGNDAVFATLFWFALLGPTGAIVYRISNTLDAMWGYRNQRFLHFGWAAARLDDVLNFVPARLTALSYALIGKTSLALQCWRHQARSYKSPNGGPVMAAGAGALQLSLGGPACYDDRILLRPQLGQGEKAQASDIPRAVRLVRQASLVWIVGLIIIEEILRHA